MLAFNARLGRMVVLLSHFPVTGDVGSNFSQFLRADSS